LTDSPSKASEFRGGIALDPNKAGLDEPIKTLALPAKLVFHGKHPCVKPGDKVLAGQDILQDTVASTSGHIEQIAELDAQRYQISLVPDGREEFTNEIKQANSPIESINAANIAGFGGAAFSTIKKLRSQIAETLPLLVINAAECEPMIACDEALMQQQASEIVAGIEALMKLTACSQCIIAIEDNKHEAIEAMQSAISKFGHSALQLKLIPSRYPGGAETVLLRQLSGNKLRKSEQPASQGMLCFNVATALAVINAINKRPFFGRVVSIAGSAANQPCNVQVHFGTPLSYLLDQTGNTLGGSTSIKIGGPISGLNIRNNEIDSHSITAKSNAVIIENIKPAALEQACIRCGNCEDVCPESLLPQQLFRFKSDLQLLTSYKLKDCIECRCCDLVCPANIPLTDYFKTGKQRVNAQQQAQASALLAEARFAAREVRLERQRLARQQALEEQKKQAAKPRPDISDINAAMARIKRKAKKPDQPDRPES